MTACKQESYTRLTAVPVCDLILGGRTSSDVARPLYGASPVLGFSNVPVARFRSQAFIPWPACAENRNSASYRRLTQRSRCVQPHQGQCQPQELRVEDCRRKPYFRSCPTASRLKIPDITARKMVIQCCSIAEPHSKGICQRPVTSQKPSSQPGCPSSMVAQSVIGPFDDFPRSLSLV